MAEALNVVMNEEARRFEAEARVGARIRSERRVEHRQGCPPIADGQSLEAIGGVVRRLALGR